MKQNILLIFSLTVLLSCNTRYAYRSKIRIKDNKPVAETKAPAVDATIEASSIQEYTVIDKKIPALEDNAVITQPTEKRFSVKPLHKIKKAWPNNVLNKQAKKINAEPKIHAKEGKVTVAQVLVIMAVAFLVIGALVFVIGYYSFFAILTAGLLIFLGAIFLVAGMIAALISSFYH